jgi:hypothetical protein
MSSSMRWSLIAGGLGLWMMNTSSSRTELWICTDVSSERNLETWHGVRGMPRLRARRGGLRRHERRLTDRVEVEMDEKKVRPGWSCEADDMTRE